MNPKNEIQSLRNRLSVVEFKIREAEKRLKTIDGEVDSILKRFDKVSEAWNTGKVRLVMDDAEIWRKISNED